MSDKSTDFVAFEELRPQILALLELHRAAQTDEARAAVVLMFEKAFLATAWHVALDLLDNGWAPGFVSPSSGRPPSRLKVVGGTDARPDPNQVFDSLRTAARQEQMRTAARNRLSSPKIVFVGTP